MKLEEFIKENNERWDDKRAPEGLWTQISDELERDNIVLTKSGFKIMALFILIVIILAVHSAILKKNTKYSIESRNSHIQYAALEEFEEAEYFYLSSINNKEKLLEEYNIDATLKKDLSLLDESYKELEKEFLDTQDIYKEVILRAMIQNHKTKLNILETVLYNYKNTNNQDNEVLY